MNNVRELAEHLMRHEQPGKTLIVGIDGMGGSGKSTFAEVLHRHWPGSAILRTDDFASWDDPLDWWPRMVAEALEPLSQGHAATFRKTDWAHAIRQGPFEEVRPPRVILEGVSATRAEFRPFLDFSVWIETDPKECLRRGLERDGASAEPSWRAWQAAEREYIARDQPALHANLIVSGQDAYDFLHPRTGAIPMLCYEDGPGMMDWLVRAFGFREKLRWLDDQGRLSHGELLAGDGIVMLASPEGYRSPRSLDHPWLRGPWIFDGVLVFVPNLEEHLECARAAGADILSEIETGEPGKRYRAADPEGHRWFFFESKS